VGDSATGLRFIESKTKDVQENVLNNVTTAN